MFTRSVRHVESKTIETFKHEPNYCAVKRGGMAKPSSCADAEQAPGTRAADNVLRSSYRGIAAAHHRRRTDGTRRPVQQVSVYVVRCQHLSGRLLIYHRPHTTSKRTESSWIRDKEKSVFVFFFFSHYYYYCPNIARRPRTLVSRQCSNFLRAPPNRPVRHGTYSLYNTPNCCRFIFRRLILFFAFCIHLVINISYRLTVIVVVVVSATKASSSSTA